MSTDNRYLVTGASGPLGRLVVNALLDAGVTDIIATSRNTASLADLAARGVTARAADFNRPEPLVEAFSGATHLLLISTHEIGSRAAGHLAAVDAAKRAGVRHIFYTSHAAADTSVSAVAPEHAVTERAIIASGMTYTILRNYIYSENLLLILPEALASGRFYGTSGDAKLAWISRRDCADAACGAMLQGDRHKNQIYDVTGPQAFSYAEIAALLTEIEGRSIVYEDLDEEAYRHLLIGRGLPESAAKVFVSLELSIRSGELEGVNDTVQRLTGRTPDRLEDFLRSSPLLAAAPESLAYLKQEPTGPA